MGTNWVRHAASAAAVLIAAGACSDEGSNDTLPSGGTGGSSSGAGGTGGGGQAGQGGGGAGSGGAAGQGGAGGSGGPDAGLAEFTAVLVDGAVHLTTSDRVWIGNCDRNPRVVEEVDPGDWRPLVDARPEGSNLEHRAHYLDGELEDACRLTNGCDVLSCDAFPLAPDRYQSSFNPLIVREYVSLGQAPGPACGFLDAGIDLDAGSDAGVRLVPNIVSRVPDAPVPIGVEIRYYRDSRCAEPITTVVRVTRD
jgi:hypothetical protein